MQKVAFTLLQRELLKTTLKEAQRNKLDVLDGKEVVFEIDDAPLANEFFQRVTTLGLNCEIEY